jgi:hypothetical protein
MKRTSFTTFFSILGFIVSFSCSNPGSNSSESYDSSPVQEEIKYEETKMTIEEMEKADPLKFLDAGGTYRPALLGGNFLIEGYIKNAATVAVYKDIVVEFSYYSKTDSEIKTETRTFYEFIQPNGTYNFRFKVNAPSATATIGWDVISALSQ